jgi:hypothetical protein
MRSHTVFDKFLFRESRLLGKKHSDNDLAPLSVKKTGTAIQIFVIADIFAPSCGPESVQ